MAIALRDEEPPLSWLWGPGPRGRWLALPPRLRRAVLGQLEHHASQRVALDLGRLLDAPWWTRLPIDDAIRAARVVAHASSCADGAPPEPRALCRRTILDHALASLLPPHGRFALRFSDLPVDGETVVAGLCAPPATVVLNRRMIAAADEPLGQGPGGWVETRVGVSTLAHEIQHLVSRVPPGPTHAAFLDEYRAWYVGFVAEAARPPRRVEALDRCRQLLTSPRYAFARAFGRGSAHGERILEFLRALGPVERWQDVLALPRDGFHEPAPLPWPCCDEGRPH